MSLSPLASLSRRHLLISGALGLGAVAGFGAVAPARADDVVWTEEFMVREETREGFDINAMHPWQIENAKFILAVIAGHDLGVEAARITLITAIVESWLFNYEPAVDLDSGGLFQQRPSMGWGTEAEVRHKKKAIDAFLGLGDHSDPAGLLQVAPDYEGWEPGRAAQAVQCSAFPDRYSEQVPAAQLIWDRYAHEVEPFTS